MEDQKNFVMAMVLSGIVLIGYYFFFGKPMAEEARRQIAAEKAAVEASIETPDTPIVVPTQAETPSLRIPIQTPALEGSFQVTGSRFDDLKLLEYAATLEEDSPPVSLLIPESEDYSAYIFDNWVRRDAGSGARTPWAVVSGEKLTPTTPVVLRHDGEGFTVDRTISVDEKFLITLSDTVSNTSANELTLTRRGTSRQHGLPEGLTNFFILHEGPVGIVDGTLQKMKHKKLSKERTVSESGTSGWAGLTDKYWLAANVAPVDTTMELSFDFSSIDGRDVYETGYEMAPLTLTPGKSVESVGYIFAGAKERRLLESYEAELGIDEFNRAIDWGALRIIVKPLTTALNWLGKTLGNYGLAILALTLGLKILVFPLFNKQYTSMAKMKKLTPELKRLKEVYSGPDDRLKLQQEMMALYKKEGANPMSGCLPLIPTIFIFFALYKTVFIDVELRHAPFFGWIQDLSARDPLSILNGFGLFPWSPDPIGLSFLAIGPLAILYGVSMAMMQTTQSTGAMQDPMQKKIFALLPWVFMFVLAPFAAGLLLYWIFNNILSFAQSYYINRKFGVETGIDTFFKKLLGRNKALPEGMDVIEPKK